jgi:ligand-binding SRPBCC domain-containing protein
MRDHESMPDNPPAELAAVLESLRIFRSPTCRGFRLENRLFLPQPRERVFAFFADAMQLQHITPEWLHFSVLTPPPICIAQGTILDYQLRLHGMPLRWQSCISAWQPPERFVDEQLRGPYRRWHHEHLFTEVDGGTLCRDVVDYEVYGGRLVHSLLVRADLLRIFDFRQSKLCEIFSIDLTQHTSALASEASPQNARSQ